MSELEDAFAFQIKAVGLPEPQREYRFAKPRRWRFDFAWPDLMVACEVEGGTWVQGRHNRGRGFEQDCFKYGQACVLGWRVLRFTGNMIERGEAIAMLEKILNDA